MTYVLVSFVGGSTARTDGSGSAKSFMRVTLMSVSSKILAVANTCASTSNVLAPRSCKASLTTVDESLSIGTLLVWSRAPLILSQNVGTLGPYTGTGTSSASIEFFQGLGWQDCCLVVHGRGMVRLMDGNGRVDHLGSNGVLLDYGLDVLVDVMVNVLASKGGLDLCGVGSVVGSGRVLILGCVLFKSALGLGVFAVVDSLVLDRKDIVGVFLGAIITTLAKIDLENL